MPPPVYIGEGDNMQYGRNVCASVYDNRRTSATAKGKDFKFCMHTEC